MGQTPCREEDFHAASATMRREVILGEVRRLDETEEGEPSLIALVAAAAAAASSSAPSLPASSSSRLSRLHTSSSDSETAAASTLSVSTTWLRALALRLVAAEHAAEGEVSTSDVLGLLLFCSASSVSKSGSIVMALAASGLLWKGAVEARPWWFLLFSGGLVPRVGKLRLLLPLLLESSSTGAADPDRVPVRRPVELCAAVGAGEDAREAGLRDRLAEGTVRLASVDGLAELRPRNESRLIAWPAVWSCAALELLDTAA